MDTPGVSKIPNIAPTRFIRESISELKKVSWPSREDTIKLTGVVIIISIIVGIFISGIDALFLRLTSTFLR
jgi:preprotein translocase subunit SecE